jgi:hypothetical protein
MSGARAQKAVAFSHRFGKLDCAGRAVGTDEISLDQLRVMAEVPDRLHAELAGDEAVLVEAVAGLSVADTRRVIEYWKQAVDGPGADGDVDRMAEERYLHASRTMGGMVKIDGWLDPLSGEVLLEALAVATPPRRQDDMRTPRQRRADAIVDLARSFLDSGQGPGSERPHLLVLTDLEALEGHGGGTHETVTGQVLTPEQIRELACDATITRIVFGPEGQPVDIGRATRVIPPAMRKAVIARDRHCQHPGCDRPARWSDIHHIIHWADGGATAIANLILLCRFHHTWEHRQTWEHRHTEAHGP